MDERLAEAAALAAGAAERRLTWEACRNVRELGGYPTASGRTTRWRSVIRADNLCRLTDAGRAALLQYGVRTIIDLRSEQELAQARHPFADARGAPDPPHYLNLPLLDLANREAMAAIEAAPTQAASYCAILDRFPDRVAAVLGAVAAAPPGGVLLHCHAGKDRTGIVAALLLALADVPDEVIAADYALSDLYLQPLYAEIIASGPQDPERLARLAVLLRSAPETMLGVLERLRARYGGAVGYARAAGLDARDLDRLRARLLGDRQP